MSPSLLEAREGRTLTNVLSEIIVAEYHEGVHPRQKELTDRLPLTKGAVSNNCNKLLDNSIIERTSTGGYTVIDEELLSLYRTHVDSFLTRESTSRRFDVDAFNDIRTTTKRGLLREFDESNLLFDIVVEAFVAAQDNSRIQTLREVMRHADHLVQSAATHIVTHPGFEGAEDPDWGTVKPVIQLAIVLEHVHADLDRLANAHDDLAQYLPGDTPAATMTTYFTNDT